MNALQTPVMPFGRFKGQPLDQLPDEYLMWLGCLDDLREPLLSDVLREMARRIAGDRLISGPITTTLNKKD